MKKSNSQSGNIFVAIFGAVALVGVLGAGVATFSKGPIQNALNLNRKNNADVEMAMTGQLAIMSATNTANQGDCDLDSYVEPPEWRTGATVPTGGGLIPNNVGVAKKDPWGLEYGYCAWDHGPVVLNASCQLVTPGTNKRLQGTDSKKYPVMAIISAGPDGVFTTTCRSFATADVTADGDLEDATDLPMVSKALSTDDDIIVTYTYEGAMASSGGLWKLKSTDTNTAYINKKIEAQNARIAGTGIFERIAAVGADFIDVISGVKLVDSATLTTCNLTNKSILRRAVSGYGFEKCDGAGNWVTASGASASSLNDLEDGITKATNNLFGGYKAGNETLSGNYNTALGISSLNALTTGNYNSAFGNETLSKLTSGIRNVAIGWNAGKNIEGNSLPNTAIGYEALLSCTTCERNTAVGYQAGKSLATGLSNTVVGSMALLSATTENGNSVLGTEAAKAATTADSNSIAGYQAAMYPSSMTRNTVAGSKAMIGAVSAIRNYNAVAGSNALSGSASSGTVQQNTAIGSGALSATAMSGSYNTAVGAAAGSLATTGNYCVAVGFNANRNCSDYNVGVGANSLYKATGQGNVAIGINTGAAITTGTQSTIIGALAMPLFATGFNNTAIGYGAVRNSTGVTNTTAVGYEAAKGASSSFTAVGYSAMSSGSALSGGTAFGYQAGKTLTNGMNTAVGYNSLANASAMSESVSIGYEAGKDSAASGNGLFIGANAGKVASSGVAIGYNTMSTTVGTPVDYNNVAIGSNALLDGSRGGDNICIGALTCAAPSGLNIAIGYDMATKTDTLGITAIGHQALKNLLSTADGATAVGSSALTAATSGKKLTAVGASALQNIQTANENTAVGFFALNNSTGDGNTGVGRNALANTTSGVNNTAFGYTALSNLSNGDNNTAFGHQTFGALATGSNNSVMGYLAVGSLTDLSNSTVVGQGITVTNGLTNVTAIGFATPVTASNTVRFGNTTVSSIQGQVAFTVASDKRLKKDIHPTDLGLDFIMKLKPVSYRMIDGNGRLDYGFIAQDIEKALEGRKTNLLTRSNDQMKTYRLRYDDLLAPMVKAVQEQQTELEFIEKDLETLR